MNVATLTWTIGFQTEEREAKRDRGVRETMERPGAREEQAMPMKAIGDMTINELLYQALFGNLKERCAELV